MTTTKHEFALFPIEKQDLWKHFKDQHDVMWSFKEIDYSNDKFDKLDVKMQNILKMILAFFASSDNIVNQNIILNLLPQVREVEAQTYYLQQAYIEAIHSVTYNQIIEAYIKDPKEQFELFNALDNSDIVKLKAQWALNYLNDESSFEQKLVAFSLVEGLAFSSSFAFIFYLRDSGSVPGLIFANELIVRDENLHYMFAVDYYLNHAKNKLSNNLIRKMIIDCYEAEIQFVNSIVEDLPGLTKKQMVQYVQYVTDTILSDYGLEKIFNVSQPFSFMTQIGLNGKTNFFERRSSEYQSSDTKKDKEGFVEDDDF